MERGFCLLASREATIVSLVLLALGALAKFSLQGGERWVLPPLVMLSLNLCACLYRNGGGFWRRRRGHLLFHGALLLLLLLFMVGRLTYFDGYLEVSEGQGFNGTPLQASQGPLHRWIFQDEVVVVQEEMDVTYARGEEGEEIRSGLRFLDGGGEEQAGRATFNRPLLYRGYRFYVPGRMGYSLLISFRPQGATSIPEQVQLGFLNLPPYPSERKAQINSFYLPGTGERVVLSLDLFGEPYREKGRWRFTLPKDYRVTVSFRRQDFRLRWGERCDLGVGTLEIQDLRRWMGYGISYDPTLPYLLGVSFLTIGGLLWIYLPLLKAAKGGEEQIIRVQERPGFPGDVSAPGLPLSSSSEVDPAPELARLSAE